MKNNENNCWNPVWKPQLSDIGKKKGALVEELCNRNINNLQYFSGIKGVIGEYNRMAKP